MEVLYKSSPLNIISDALLRLFKKWDNKDEEEGIFNINIFFSKQLANPLYII